MSEQNFSEQIATREMPPEPERQKISSIDNLPYPPTEKDIPAHAKSFAAETMSTFLENVNRAVDNCKNKINSVIDPVVELGDKRAMSLDEFAWQEVLSNYETADRSKIDRTNPLLKIMHLNVVTIILNDQPYLEYVKSCGGELVSKLATRV